MKKRRRVTCWPKSSHY